MAPPPVDHALAERDDTGRTAASRPMGAERMTDEGASSQRALGARGGA